MRASTHREPGRLKTTTANGDINDDAAHEKIYSYGARSFSIWDEKGSRIYDSGTDFERFLANYADNNVDNEPWEEGRSNDKGLDLNLNLLLPVS